MIQSNPSTKPCVNFLTRSLSFFAASALMMNGLLAEEKTTSPLVYCVAYAPELSAIFTKKAEGRYDSITLSTANVLEVKDAPVDNGNLSFFGPANPEGKHPLAATADVSQHANPLIVLNPNAAAEQAPYKATVVDASLTHFPLGSYQLVNLSPHPIRLTQDKDSTEVTAGGTHIFTPKNAADAPTAITIDYKLENEWLLLTSSNWSHRNDRRTLVCFLEDKQTGRIITKSIPLRPMARP